jgi:hypothetical protein
MGSYARGDTRVLLPKLTPGDLEAIADLLNNLSLIDAPTLLLERSHRFDFLQQMFRQQLEIKIKKFVKLNSRLSDLGKKFRDLLDRHNLHSAKRPKGAKAEERRVDRARKSLAQMESETKRVRSAINIRILLNCEGWAMEYLSDNGVDWQRDGWGDPFDNDEGVERKKAWRKAQKTQGTGSWVQTPDGWREARLLNRWSDAGMALKSVIVDNPDLQRTYCHLPPVALPGKRPRFWIRNPDDLACWLLARMLAGHQWHAIVKCARCGCFGAHERARPGMKYCGDDCLADANRDSGLQRYESKSEEPQELRRIDQLDRLEKEKGILPRSLRIERGLLQGKVWQGPRPTPAQPEGVLTLDPIPKFCPTCEKNGERQKLTFAPKLQHRYGSDTNVWYCQKCSQVIRKRPALPTALAQSVTA